MLHEKLHDPIDVQVAFVQGKVLPRKFLWSGRVYNIQKLTMVHKEKQGQDQLYYFSVTDEDDNFYRLTFSTRDLRWHINELHTMG